MITLKRNIVIPHDYYSLTLIVSSKKLRLKMLNEDFSKDKEMFGF